MQKEIAQFQLDGKPSLMVGIPLGLQHLLAMFIGNITPAILLSSIMKLSSSEGTFLIQCSMIVAALSTLIQLFPIKILNGVSMGSKLPVFMGLTYVFLPTILSSGKAYGLATIFGCQIVAGLISIIYSILLRRIRKYFPPIVTGTVVLAIGLTLFPIAINYMAGGIGNPTYGNIENWIISIGVLLTVLWLNENGKGMYKTSALLIGILLGYFISIIFGKVDFNPIFLAKWIEIPKVLSYGLEFRWDLIFIFSILYFIVSIQMMGDFSVSSMASLKRYPNDGEIGNGILGNAIACIISAIFNSFPTATYSQNSGMVALNKVCSRYVIGLGALGLLIAGICPKFSAIFITIPHSVIGGATIVVFSMMSTSGMKLITMEKFNGREMLIVGVSLALGIGITTSPETISKFPELFQILFGKSSVVMATFSAVFLNIFLKEK